VHTLNSILILIGGAGFIFGGIFALVKGYIPLKTGHKVERVKDRAGFWVGAIGLIAIGVAVMWQAAR